MRPEQPEKKQLNLLDQHSNNVQKKHQETFIRNQNTCPLCDSTLEIKAISYLEGATLREEASCPKCQIKARIKDHRMH